MTVIAVYMANGVSHYIRAEDASGRIDFSENAADASEFADAGAANSFLSGKTSLPYQLVTVSGIVHYGKKTHT
jgi:hypothetical protein